MEKPLIFQVVDRERETWIRSGFKKTDVCSQAELIEECMAFIGPHRIPISFYLSKVSEASTARRASVVRVETASDAEIEPKNTIKEALIKNPSVIQLLNPAKGPATTSGQVVLKFMGDSSDAFFELPSSCLVSRFAFTSTKLTMQLKRTVNDDAVVRWVTIIIKDASETLHDLLLEATRDPLKSGKFALGGNVTVQYRESLISFVPPAGLEEPFWPPEDSGKKGTSNKKTTKQSSNSLVPNEKDKGKQCSFCGIRGTPQWRRGPEGAGTLCNACGVKWKHGKLGLSSSTSSTDLKTKTESTSSAALQNATSKSEQPPKEAFVPLKKRKFWQTKSTSLEDAPAQPQ